MRSQLAVALLSSIAAVSAAPIQEAKSLIARGGAGSVVSGAGLNWYTSSLSTGNSGRSDPAAYTCFSGSASNFPSFSSWMNFNSMWSLNQQWSLNLLESSDIQSQMHNSITQVAAAAKVDARLVLAVIMQESTGNVNVGCTANGVENCGLMQAYTGSVSYNPSNSQASITQMVQDGTQGTAAGGGLVQWFQTAQTSGNPYNVIRGYNSGTIDLSNLNSGDGSTNAYVSDVANRLLGWDGNDPEGHRAACGF